MAIGAFFARGPAYKINNQPIRDGQLLIATDSRQLFIDQGYARIEITDILVVDELPDNNVIVNKLYYVDNGNILAIFNGTKWIQINAQQLITTGSKKGTLSIDGVDVAINGLGTAAYSSKEDFDPAGAAGAIIGSTDDSVDAHTILGIRNRVDKIEKDMNTSLATEVSNINTKIDNNTSTLNTKIDDSVSTINTNVENKFKSEITNINNSIDNKLFTTNQYTIQKLNVAEDNSVATYSLYKDGNPIGEKINIPKDYLVRSAEIKTCEKKNNPLGCNSGDKYIDFVINSVEGDGNETHIYLNINDLIKPYSPGDCIKINNNYISVKVNSGNGLDINNDYITMSEVTTTDSGAMSAEDKKKLDSIADGSQANKIESTSLNGVPGTIDENKNVNLTLNVNNRGLSLSDNNEISLKLVPGNGLMYNSDGQFTLQTADIEQARNGAFTYNEKDKLLNIAPNAQVNVIEGVSLNSVAGAVDENKNIDLKFSVNKQGLSLGDDNEITLRLVPGHGLEYNSDGQFGMKLVNPSNKANGSMSFEDKLKLDDIAERAQVNVVENVTLNGVSGLLDTNTKTINLPLTVSNQGLSIGNNNEIGLKLVPGNGLEYNSDGQFTLQVADVTQTRNGAITYQEKDKLSNIEDGAEVNDIENVSLNGVAGVIGTDKNIDLSFSVNNQGLLLGNNNEISLNIKQCNGFGFNSDNQFGMALAETTTSYRDGNPGSMSIEDKNKLAGQIDINAISYPFKILEDTDASLTNVSKTYSTNINSGKVELTNKYVLYMPASEGTSTDGTDGYMTAAYAKKLEGIEDKAQINKIESIQLGTVSATITNKQASIPFSVNQNGLSLSQNNEISLNYVPGNGLAMKSGSLGLDLATQTTNGAMLAADKLKIDSLQPIYNVSNPFTVNNNVLSMTAASKTNDGYMTIDQATKLDGIELKAQENRIESITVGNVKATITNKDAVIPINVDPNGLSFGSNNSISLNYVPGHGLAMKGGSLGLDLATQSNDGAMSSTDKTKLDNLKSIYNVNAPFDFSNDTLSMAAASSANAGYMTIDQATKLDGIELNAQENKIESIKFGLVNAVPISNKQAVIPFSVDQNGLSLGVNNEISLNYVPGNGLAMKGGSLGLDIATQTDAGAMSAADKTKLDSMKSIDTVSAPLVLNGTQLSIQAATTTDDGYMTSVQANKLNGISDNAQPNIIESITFAGSSVTVTNKQADIPFSVKQEGLSLGENNEISFLYVPGNGLAINQDHALGMNLATPNTVDENDDPVDGSAGAMSADDKTALDDLVENGVRKFSQTIGNGSDKIFVINHQLHKPHVMVSGFNNEGRGMWLDYQITDESHVTVQFEEPPAENTVTVVVIG